MKRSLLKRSFKHFLLEFWSEISPEEFQDNWHIDIFCDELEKVARRVGEGLPKEYDLIVNVPPGTTKTITFMIMFPVWCWINWHWMRFITASYSSSLSLESATFSRDIIKSDKFQKLFPELYIRYDKDKQSNFKIMKQEGETSIQGGNRFSTSVGGTLTGFHGHILLVDDPLDPKRAHSDLELQKANRWISQTLSTRKVDKRVTPTIMIMQRLHQNDPTGNVLDKKKSNIRHISLPGEIRNYREYLKPQEYIEYYEDDLLDPVRMNWKVMEELEADLGQYGYAGQIGQNPVPPSGGMFKVAHFAYLQTMPSKSNIVSTVRYWDKAGTDEKEAKAGYAYTAGVKMHLLSNGKYLISDVKRGQWSTDEREDIIRETAEADGQECVIWVEQEPGSGGKESAEGTVRNLAGYVVHTERPTGDKIYRADPLSVQVNHGNVLLLNGDWNHDFVEEYRFFPFSICKDQVDSGSGAFSKIKRKKVAGPVL